MARLLSVATGNWGTSTTWGLVDATSSLVLAYGTSPSATTTVSTTNLDSATFTPGAITVAGVAIMLASKSTGTNTYTLTLRNTTNSIDLASATLSQSNFPSADTTLKQGGWLYFKFSSPVTTTAGRNYVIRLVSSGTANNAAFYTNGTANNWLRLVVTSTNQAPAAGDDMWVVGDGPTDTKVVTFDGTTTNAGDYALATDYGSAPSLPADEWGAINISSGSELKFANSASTNYTLRVSGNVVVFAGGTFSIGKSGAAIPRTGTAYLCLESTAAGSDAELVIKPYAYFNAYGESPTSGKNVVRTKLTADVTASQDTTASPASVGNDTGWKSGQEVVFTSSKYESTNALNFQWEEKALAADAGASSIQAGTVTFAHKGTSPLQTYVALLTRNVVINSAAGTFKSTIYAPRFAYIDCEWAAFRDLGTTTSNPAFRVLDPSDIRIQYCCFRDCPYGTLYISGTDYATMATADSITIDDNVLHNMGSAANGNTAFLITGSGAGVKLGTCNNNIVTGSNKTSGRYTNGVLFSCVVDNTGWVITGFASGNSVPISQFNGQPNSSTAPIGAPGCALSVEYYGVFSASGVAPCLMGRSIAGGLTSISVKCWTSRMYGVYLSAAISTPIDIESYGLLYGCGVSPSTIPTIAYIKSLKALSDGTNACTNALLADYSGGTDIVIGDLDVATSGSFAAPTTPISLTGTYKQPVRILVLRSNAALTLGNSSFMFGGSGLETYGSFAVQYNNATSSAFTQYMYGKASLDTNIYDGASGASMRVAPNSASYVVRIPVGRITVNSGGTRTVSLKARASGSGAEAAYAGYGSTYPKLYAGANAAVGLTADTLIDTMAVAYLPGGASAGSWETLSGTLTATGGGNFTDNGQIELYMEVLGTAGWINVDTLAIT